jgi:hypothetical protein
MITLTIYKIKRKNCGIKSNLHNSVKTLCLNNEQIKKQGGPPALHKKEDDP